MNYQVQVHDQSQWHRDGTPVVLSDCGHHHRSPEAAYRCLRKLQRPYGDGSRPAAWCRANVYHDDGSALTADEYDAAVEDLYRREQRRMR